MLYEQLINLLNDGKIKDLKAELNELNSFDAAKFFEILPDDKKLIVFRLLTKDNAAETFSYMDSDLQEHIIKSISVTKYVISLTKCLSTIQLTSFRSFPPIL